MSSGDIALLIIEIIAFGIGGAAVAIALILLWVKVTFGRGV